MVNAAGGRRRWAYSRAWRVRRVRPRALIGIAHRYGRIATRMAGGGVGRPRPTHPLPLCLPVAGPSMVARIGFSATTSRESRQGRKAAAAATMSGAGARAGASCLLGAWTWRAFRLVARPGQGLARPGVLSARAYGNGQSRFGPCRVHL